MPEPLWPRDGIHFIRLGDDIIMLDVAADTYSCLVGAGPVVRLEDAGRITIGDADLAMELKAHSLVQTNRPLRAPQTPVLASREVPQSPVRTDKTTVAPEAAPPPGPPPPPDRAEGSAPDPSARA